MIEMVLLIAGAITVLVLLLVVLAAVLNVEPEKFLAGTVAFCCIAALGVYRFGWITLLLMPPMLMVAILMTRKKAH